MLSEWLPMRVYEFAPKFALDDLRASAIFQEADAGMLLFEDMEKTTQEQIAIDCTQRRATGLFTLTHRAKPMDPYYFSCILRPVRKSTPGKKVWVFHCACGHKITANIYCLDGVVGCRVCLKMNSYKWKYAIFKAKNWMTEYDDSK